jgi:glucokinase
MALVAGVDIGGTDIKLGIVTDGGEILASGRIATHPEAGPKTVASRVRAWLESNGSGLGPIVAGGVDCAGLIDGEHGVLHVSPNLAGWIDVPLKAIFEERLGCAVTVENDANAAAYGEWVRGAGRGLRNFVCLTLGTGVGGGIVCDGALYRGSTGFAGEIGHTVIAADGPRCACGNHGCLEALISAGAIVARAREMLRSSGEGRPRWEEPLSPGLLSKAAASGDAIAVRVFAETGRYLGIGLTNIVHMLAPEAIAIGGGVAGAGDLILEPARATLRRCVMDPAMASVSIVPAELGNKASFLGVALLAAAVARDSR